MKIEGLKNSFDVILIAIIFISILLLFGINLSHGDADISSGELIRILTGSPAEYKSWSFIVEARLNRSIVAIFGGGALAISGLILQVFSEIPWPVREYWELLQARHWVLQPLFLVD